MRQLLVYVEGPSDRDILRAWAFRFGATLGRAFSSASVILGGRQPRRAVEHFRSSGGSEGGWRGMCVLDRDGGDETAAEAMEEPGLEFFTWSRRHIESYLLVPDAIRRTLRIPAEDPRVDRVFRELLPPVGDENAFRELDAKRLLSRHGPLERALGSPIPQGRVARAMRAGELHGDIHKLMERVQDALRVLEP